MPPALAHQGPSTLRLAKRFFWKECRRLSVLVEGVLLMTLALMTLVWWFTPRNVDLSNTMYVIAVGGGAMLAVAAAVTLFSVEKEEGTAELLERLPRNVKAMTLGKLAAAIELVALNTLMYLLFAGVFSSATTSMWEVITFNLPQASLLVLEAFVWSLVASLACANPLVAAVLGIALASVSVQLAVFVTNPEARGYAPAIFTAAMPARLALAGVGALIAGWLVSRWPTPPRVRHKSEANIDEPRRRYLRWPRQRMGLFGRLFWQTLRQSWATAVVATLLGLFLTIMCFVTANGLLEIGDDWGFMLAFSLLFAPAMAGAVVFRADQRRGAYRFLAEHAGRPRMLWLVRNTAGLAMVLTLVLLVTLVLIGVVWFAISIQLNRAANFGGIGEALPGIELIDVSRGLYGVPLMLSLVGVAVLTAYAWGQFFSLTVRSDVIAAMLALITSIAIGVWIGVVFVWRLPPLAFLLPLAIGALLASLLRMRDWMFDRRGVWRWAAPIAALVAPLVWLAWAVPAERLAQVAAEPVAIRTGAGSSPNTDVDLQVERLPNGAIRVVDSVSFDELVNQAQEERRLGKEVAEAYLRLEGEEVTYDEVEGRYDEYGFPETIIRPVHGRLDGKALEEFLRLSRIKCRLALSRFETPSVGSGLQAIALMDSPDAKEPIDLDGRLERLLACRRVAIQQSNFGWLQDHLHSGYLADEFIAWATEEDQTSERIKKAIVGLRENEKLLIDPVGRLMNDHRLAKEALSGEHGSLLRVDKNNPPRAGEWLAFLSYEAFGFERKRALKALDLITAYEAAYLAEGMRALTSSTRVSNWIDSFNVEDNQLVASLSYTTPSRMGSYFSNLQTLADARTSYLVPRPFRYHESPLTSGLRNWIAGVARRRAERVRLALIAYRIDHDEYPENLEALVSPSFDSYQILDPFSNEIFGWTPGGFDLPVAHFEDSSVFSNPPAADTPMLWCGGSGLATPERGRAGIEKGVVFHMERAERIEKNQIAKTESDDASLVPVMYLRTAAPYIANGSEFWLPVPK